jgi:hypothetical protein
MFSRKDQLYGPHFFASSTSSTEFDEYPPDFGRISKISGCKKKLVYSTICHLV